MTLLKINGLSKSFGGLLAIDKVSLTLQEGEILGLIGPNGAGKTTLFNMISGTFPPSQGKIEFNGQDITGMPPHKVCNLGIVRTFQIVKPFANLSVVDNVMVGAFLRKSSLEIVEKKAREMVDFTGLAQYVDEPAQNLTTSARKRLELARALATEPKLLLLDEVMAGLTPTESLEVVKLIRKIRETGVTILVIEHVMKAIMSLSDRVAVLHHGELIAEGSPSVISNDKNVIQAYLGEEYQIAED